MALSESALSELRAAIDVGQGGDLIRHLAEWGLQQLIEAEATDPLRAARAAEITSLWRLGIR